MKRTMLYLSLLAVSCSVSAAKYPVLTESSPEKAGFNVERLNQMDRWISQQVDAGYPGVNLLIIKDNQIVYRKARERRKVRWQRIDGAACKSYHRDAV